MQFNRGSCLDKANRRVIGHGSSVVLQRPPEGSANGLPVPRSPHSVGAPRNLICAPFRFA